MMFVFNYGYFTFASTKEANMESMVSAVSGKLSSAFPVYIR